MQENIHTHTHMYARTQTSHRDACAQTHTFSVIRYTHLSSPPPHTTTTTPCVLLSSGTWRAPHRRDNLLQRRYLPPRHRSVSTGCRIPALQNQPCGGARAVHPDQWTPREAEGAHPSPPICQGHLLVAPPVHACGLCDSFLFMQLTCACVNSAAGAKAAPVLEPTYSTLMLRASYLDFCSTCPYGATWMLEPPNCVLSVTVKS